MNSVPTSTSSAAAPQTSAAPPLPALQTQTSPIADVANSSDENDKHLVIRQVTDDIITFSKPFTRGGVMAIGGRGTAIRLPSSDIFIYVSTPHSPATAETIARMGGQVKWLVTPDGEHHMFMDEYVKAYPGAQAITIAKGAEAKPHINWAGIFGKGGEDKKYGFEPEISLHRVSAFLNDELLAIHHPSGTLLEADMLFNLPPTEQYSRAGGIPSLMSLLGGGKSMSPDGFIHGKAAGALTKDKELLKRELQPIHSAKWDRVIPCHGDTIETGGRVAWDQVWAKFA